MKTVTNNEDYVRLRIFEGDLKLDDAAKELLELERDQNAALRNELRAMRETANSICTENALLAYEVQCLRAKEESRVRMWSWVKKHLTGWRAKS